MHGRGTLVVGRRRAVRRYEGDYREGERHGAGRMARPDGRWYEGEWAADPCCMHDGGAMGRSEGLWRRGQGRRRRQRRRRRRGTRRPPSKDMRTCGEGWGVETDGLPGGGRDHNPIIEWCEGRRVRGQPNREGSTARGERRH